MGQTMKYAITIQRRLSLAECIPSRNTSTDGARSTVDTICSFCIPPPPLYQNIRLISWRITPCYQWYIQARLYAYCIIFATIVLAILPGVSIWQARLLYFARLNNIMSHRKPAGVPTISYFETRTRPPLTTWCDKSFSIAKYISYFSLLWWIVLHIIVTGCINTHCFIGFIDSSTLKKELCS